MIIWLIFIAVTILLTYFASSKSNNRVTKDNLIILLSIWLGWFVSFGGKALIDQNSYLILFNQVRNSEISGIIGLLKKHIYSITGKRDTFEIGYVLLNVIFAKLGFSYVGFIFIFSFVMNLLLLKFVLRFDNHLLAIIILIGSSLYSQQANLIRQMMVVSMFAYSIKYIEKREFWKYSLFVFIGSTIHMSSLVLFPLYFVIYRNIPKLLVIFVWVISVYININGIEFTFLENIKTIYYNDSLTRIGRPEELVFDITRNALFFISILVFDYKKINKLHVQIAYNLFFIGVVLSNLSALSFSFFRISLYFLIFGIVIIPMIPEFIITSSFARKINVQSYSNVAMVLIVLYFIKILGNRIFVESITLGTEFYSFSDLF